MLRGRLQLRNYLIISYLGLTIGMVLSYDMPNQEKFIFAIICFIIGIISHYQKTFIGYYVSLLLNTAASGFLLVYVLDYVALRYEYIDIVIANGILLILFVGITYSVSLKWRRNIMYYISIFILVGWLIFLFNSNVFEESVLGVMKYAQYLGYSFMFVLYITGVKSELLLYGCSIATLIIFLIVLLAGILIVMAKSDSDLDLDFGDGVFSSSSKYRYKHRHGRYYMWDLFFYNDACYFDGYGRRKDTYVSDNEEYFKKEEQKEIYQQTL